MKLRKLDSTLLDSNAFDVTSHVRVTNSLPASLHFTHFSSDICNAAEPTVSSLVQHQFSLLERLAT